MNKHLARGLAVATLIVLLGLTAGGLSTTEAGMGAPPAGVAACALPNPDQVVLYVDENFAGSCEVRNIGEYSWLDSPAVPNDTVSSIRVGSNITATLCQHHTFEGTCSVLTVDTASLASAAVGDNAASSLKVQPRSGSIIAKSAFTYGGDYAPKSVFQPGEEIVQGIGLLNSGSATGWPRLVWSTTDPLGYQVSALSTVQWLPKTPGSGAWLWSFTVPADSLPGTYTFTGSATYVTETEQSTTFTVAFPHKTLLPVVLRGATVASAAVDAE